MEPHRVFYFSRKYFSRWAMDLSSEGYRGERSLGDRSNTRGKLNPSLNYEIHFNSPLRGLSGKV